MNTAPTEDDMHHTPPHHTRIPLSGPLKLLVGLSLPLLSACAGSVDGGVFVDTTSLNVISDHGAILNGRYQSVVCHDRRTVLNVSYDYFGDLSHWTSELRALEGSSASTRVHHAHDGRIGTTVNDRHEVAAFTAPLPTRAASVVVDPPPHILGYARLHVVAYSGGGAGTRELVSEPLPILAACR